MNKAGEGSQRYVEGVSYDHENYEDDGAGDGDIQELASDGVDHKTKDATGDSQCE